MRVPLFLLALILHSPAAFSFPEMVRHAYTNCSTCHASPTGGGILTEYGRALSKELLNGGGFFFESGMDLKTPLENTEEQPLGGSVSLPRGFSLGGDVRALQVVEDNPRETKGQFLFMQADLELAVSDGKRIVVDGVIGRAEPLGKARYANDYLLSRRHFVSVKIGPEGQEDRFQVRFGRFFPAYGINVPEHTLVTRRQLGFDQQQETYNAEFSYIDEQWSLFATYLGGRPDNENRTHETGGALQLSRAFGSSYRAGLNGFFGDDRTRADRPSRWMAGAFGILGFTPEIYALAEVDWSYDRVAKSGLAEFFKQGWEFSRGLHLVAVQQLGKPSYMNSSAWRESYSLGLQYFPRVHWDFVASAGRERSTTASRDFSSVFLFLAHYYL